MSKIKAYTEKVDIMLIKLICFALKEKSKISYLI